MKIGGGSNHRIGLYDAVLIKNNHIDYLKGDVVSAIRLARKNSPADMHIQVEVRTFDELKSALTANPDSILVDNMSPDEIVKAVEIVRDVSNSIPIEASGGINEKSILEYAQTGVNYISVGALTHSVKASDLSLRLESHD